MSDEQQPEAGKPVDEMEVIRLAKHLFREYAAEFNIDTEQMMKVKIKDFYNWYHETNQNVLLGTEQNIELREKLKLSEVSCDLFHQLMSCPFRACMMLYPLWPMMVLSGRPPLKTKPLGIRIVLHVGFDDGKVMNLIGQCANDPKDPFTDASINTLFRNYGMKMIDELGQHGLDEWYAQAAQYPPELLQQMAAQQQLQGGDPNNHLSKPQPPAQKLWVPGS